MRCQNKFCIYQNDGECFHKEVPHGENGNCLRCIHMKISNEALESLKKDTVDDLEYFAKEKVKKHHTPGYFD